MISSRISSFFFSLNYQIIFNNIVLHSSCSTISIRTLAKNHTNAPSATRLSIKSETEIHTKEATPRKCLFRAISAKRNLPTPLQDPNT